MTVALSSTDAKHLLRLCKIGRLFEVEKWISNGNSLVVPVDVRPTPLEIALETGFHSLVELLLRNEANQVMKNARYGKRYC